MTIRATPELIEERVRAVAAKHTTGPVRALALRADPVWDGNGLNVDGQSVRVIPCNSPLAVRTALAQFGDDATTIETILVVLCDLADRDLGDDLLSRFTRPRVEPLEPWSAVRSLFGVRELDAAFGEPHNAWLASALLAYAPASEASQSLQGTSLTLDVAFRALSGRILGTQDFDIDGILKRSRWPSPFAELTATPDDVQSKLLDAFAIRNGPLGILVSAILRAGRGAELIPLGIAARAVFGDGDVPLGVAVGRFEARCGDLHIDPLVGIALAVHAESLVQELFVSNVVEANRLVAEAESIAASIDAPHASASDLLQSGFDARLRDCAGMIDSVVTNKTDSTLQFAVMREALVRAGQHALVAHSNGLLRVEHARMAARLAAWLISDEASDASGFADAAVRYATESSWVDRARRRLWRGDSDAEISAVYSRVVDAVVARRSRENKRFAELLKNWSETPTDPSLVASEGLVPLEDVLHATVGPLAQSIPVLFVVLDGCSLPTFSELSEQFAIEGFREIARSHGGMLRRAIGIAVLPTVTEVSRASLLAGKLDQGGQDHERRHFDSNRELRVDNREPVIFHQNALRGPAGTALAPVVTQAMRADGAPVVAVVINTIDDQLKRGDFTSEYRLSDLGELHGLLADARTHGRAVVITADHGHVLAQPSDGGTGAFVGGGEGGERWRAADRAPTEGEVLLQGPRVLLGKGGGVIAPWLDDYRYGAKAGGYHGGATPEEVLVPLAVYLPAGQDEPEGYGPVDANTPLWWNIRVPIEEPSRAELPEISPRAKGRGRAKVPSVDQTTMFDPPEVAQPRTAPSEPIWIQRLLTSEVWEAQRSANARARLDAAQVSRVLESLHRRGGLAPFAAIVTEAGIPQNRVDGFLAVLARQLNVDGYVAFEVDTATREVRLELAVIAQQFGIELS